MNEVLEYIRERYNKTGWHYIRLGEITNALGDGARTDLNKLKQNGIIRRRDGANGALIEYLPNNDNNELD